MSKHRSASRSTRASSSTGARMANKLFVNNSNGRKARATKTVFNDATGREIFTLDVGHGEGRPRRDQPRPRRQHLRRPARHPERHPRDGDRHQRRARHDQRRCSPPATTPTSTSASGRCRAPKGQGRRDRAGRRALHGEQVDAGEAGGGVAVPEVPRHARVTCHVGDRHRLPPDPQDVGRQRRRCRTTGRRTPATRSPTTSC